MKRLLIAVFILAMLAAFIQPVQARPPASVSAQATEPPIAVRQLFNAMTPEERVGQLFLVTLNGTQTDDTSAIYDLIVNYHVGGVVLLAANDNFTDAPNTITDAHDLIARLQEVERINATTQVLNIETGRLGSPAYVPLWVGIAQDGNGAPTDQILSGLTPLPSEMAVGATWDVSLAEEVGATLGRDLSALGFNFYFGPSLDVLDQPSPFSNRDLGTRSFGGDPYWVGEMGRAYIHGLHRGSANRMMVIGTHFPGRGSSDRLPEDEVATVRKSLEQLKQVELVPFFAVTGNAPDSPSMADGVLVSHIRYQGFQNNIRATTRPFSFDSVAMEEILKLPQLAAWHENGGLIVSDDLGSRAVHEFYAPGDSLFNARLIVRDAFLAGNDLLYLGNIYTSDPIDQNSTVKQILNYFAQRYAEDTAFAQRVDAAALRILARKYQIYGSFGEARVTPDAVQLTRIGISDQITFQVASRAATLVSPDRAELDSVLPDPPAPSDYIVFLTDTSLAKQCSLCIERPVLAVDALQEAVLRLYGPNAGGQAFASRLSSYSFNDIANLLNGVPPETMESNLRRASWVVISIKDSSASQPELIQRFLAERQDLLRSQKVIVFSFGAPYYFDSTDIAKLTAYFTFYGKSPAFVDAAARALYGELTPQGHSPVSIPGSGYDLIDATSPEPNQIISLFLDLPAAPVSTTFPSQTPEPTPIPSFNIGDAITVRTGTILDHNGNPVPDGTVVHFTASVSGEVGQQQDANTTAGSASTSFRIEKQGLMEIRAASDPATISAVLRLTVIEGAPAVVTVMVPVLTETVEPPTPTPTPTVESDFIDPEGQIRFGGWMLSLFVLGGGAIMAYWIGSSAGKARWGIRWALCALVGGLLVYNYLALGLQGSVDILQSEGGGALVGLVLIGQIVGILCAWVWMARKK